MFFNDLKKYNQEASIHAAKKLIRVVCDQSTMKISLPKLRKVKNEINLIDFCWGLAICESKYETFGAVDQDTESLYIKLNAAADFYSELLHKKILKLSSKIVDEITPYYISAPSKLLFKVSPRRLAKLLKTVPEVRHIINNDLVDAQILNTKASYTETSNPTKENNPTNHCDDIDTIIDTVLKDDFTTLIRKTFPEYSGKIYNKTSAPHKLVIKVMVIMIKRGYQDITGSAVKGFIEEHINGNHERQTLAKLDEMTDDYIIVSGVTFNKLNITKKVGNYKKIFEIK